VVTEDIVAGKPPGIECVKKGM